MKPPSSPASEPSAPQSSSSGGGQPSAKQLYEQRKSYSKTVAAMGEVSEYKVEHLVTLPVDRKEGVLTIEDSVRKLQLLDARGKVWKQEILLVVDDKSVKLADCETKEELEVFPLSTVQHVEPVINACHYNSICAITIKEAEQRSPDIHLYQCPQIPADVIYADISSAVQDAKHKKSKKSRPDTLRRHRAAIEASSHPPTAPQINVKDRVELWAKAAQIEGATSPRLMNGLSETPVTVAFKVNRDVQMLNHACDDIEAFVALLQKSTEASRELTAQKARVGSKKANKLSKGRPPGNRLMELRARLPPEERFIDCFQKFRFCFNLLSKLKDQLKNPNSVELVHYLFQPLGMIIHVSSAIELARVVKCPLLTKDTIEFLRNCATTQELKLWQDLGDFWTKSKGEFPKDMFFPLYVPRYLSGWEPPPIPSMDSEPRKLAAAIQEHAEQVHRHEEEWKANGSNIEDALKPLSPVPEPGPIRRFSSFDGKDVATVSKQYTQNPTTRNTTSSSSRKLCRAMYDFAARNDHELSVKLDDLLDVLDDSKSWWRVQNQEGDSGYVPENLMLVISSAAKSPSSPNPPNQNIPLPPPPPPPPPPVEKVDPPPVPIYATVRTDSPPTPKPKPVKTSVNSSVSNDADTRQVKARQEAVRTPSIDTETLQQELRSRVASQNQRNFVIPKKSASSNKLVINKTSKSHEIEHWIRSLGVSDITIQSLGVLDGAQIFTLTRDELKEICGEEGARIHSQLMIQRHNPGFATITEKSELGKIMAKRREEIDEF